MIKRDLAMLGKEGVEVLADIMAGTKIENSSLYKFPRFHNVLGQLLKEDGFAAHAGALAMLELFAHADTWEGRQYFLNDRLSDVEEKILNQKRFSSKNPPDQFSAVVNECADIIFSSVSIRRALGRHFRKPGWGKEKRESFLTGAILVPVLLMYVEGID